MELKTHDVFGAIDKDVFFCEPDIKVYALKILTAFGTETNKETKVAYWKDKPAVEVLQEIADGIEKVLNNKEQTDNMDEDMLDQHKKLRCRFILIRKQVKDIMKKDKEEE